MCRAERTTKPLFCKRGGRKASLGGLEPPTFRLTAERANRLRHRDTRAPLPSHPRGDQTPLPRQAESLAFRRTAATAPKPRTTADVESTQRVRSVEKLCVGRFRRQKGSRASPPQMPAPRRRPVPETRGPPREAERRVWLRDGSPFAPRALPALCSASVGGARAGTRRSWGGLVQRGKREEAGKKPARWARGQLDFPRGLWRGTCWIKGDENWVLVWFDHHVPELRGRQWKTEGGDERKI